VLGALTFQSPLGGIAGITNNPSLNAIFQTLNTSAQAGFTGSPFKIPGIPDSFTSQAGIFPPTASIPPVTPPPPGTTPPTPGAAVPPVNPTPPGATPPSPAIVPPPSGMPITPGANPLTSPTTGLFSAPTGINPLLGGGNPLLGGLPTGGSAAGNLGGMLQMLVQLLLVLRQQQGAPGVPGAPGAPVDPEKKALEEKIAALEKKLEAQELKEVNKANEEEEKAPAKEKEPAKEAPPPAKDETPAKSKGSQDIDNILKNFTTIDANGSGYLDASELSKAGYGDLAKNVDALMFATISPGRDAYYGVNAGDLRYIQGRLDDGDSLGEIAADLKEKAMSSPGITETTFDAYVAGLRAKNP
jgi:hypothetical protein